MLNYEIKKRIEGKTEIAEVILKTKSEEKSKKLTKKKYE
jgi:hypothetical protein